LYIDVRQCNGTRQFAEERGFLEVGLDEGEVDFWGPEFQRDARESGAGTDIGNVVALPGDGSLVASSTTEIVPSFLVVKGTSVTWQEHAGSEEALAEMPGDDLFGIANGGEIDTLIPAQKYIDVCRYIRDEFLVVDIADKGMKQFGDAGGIHAGRL